MLVDCVSLTFDGCGRVDVVVKRKGKGVTHGPVEWRKDKKARQSTALALLGTLL